MDLNRRDFLKMTSASAAGIGVSPMLMTDGPVAYPYPVCIFSLCLQFLDYEQLGEVVASLGFDGAELVIREGRHIGPEKVKTDLPRAVKALRRAGVEVPMIVTGINEASHPLTEEILGTAANQGIKYYRMGKYGYDDKQPVFKNLENFKRKLEELEPINRKYQIKGGYQNHSGPWGMVGGAVWDLYFLLKDLDPEYIGVQYDIMHATAEGGFSWVQALEVIFPWVNSLAIKDFLWEWNPKKERWETRLMPLGEGMVNYKKFIGKIEPILYSLPVTIHCEYDLGGAESGSTNPSMSKGDIYRLLKKDLEYFKNHIIGKIYGKE